MAKNKHQTISPQTKDEAMKTAKATQRPGQTKEQTKLIAQGIEKGIAHYKKQQKEKSRTLNRKLNKVSQQLALPEHEVSDNNESEIIYKQSASPWVFLVISWLGFVLFLLFEEYLLV